MKDYFIDNGHQAANDLGHLIALAEGQRVSGLECSKEEQQKSDSLPNLRNRPGNPNRSKYSELTGQSTANEGAIEREWGLWRSAKGLP